MTRLCKLLRVFSHKLKKCLSGEDSYHLNELKSLLSEVLVGMKEELELFNSKIDKVWGGLASKMDEVAEILESKNDEILEE